MPKLNRLLITSIIEDIKELVSVANEMCSWIGKVNHLSWRFPTRSARNVNAMAIVQNHKGSAGEMYILLLEIAYDRMHFVLRLVVEFIESYPFIEDFFESKDGTRTKSFSGSMSLANVLRTLWHRLKLVPETITRNVIKSKHMESSTSRGCQASGSLSSCESCCCASRAVKDLAKAISTAVQEDGSSSVILAELELVCADPFDKTQWAVMSKLAEAIDKDLKILLETTSAIRAKSEADAIQLEISLQDFSAQVERLKSGKSSLEIRVRETTDRLLAVEKELQEFEEVRMKLTGENRSLKESFSNYKEDLSKSETLLAVTRQQMVEMAESKLALEDSVKNLYKEVTTARKASAIDKAKLQESLDLHRGEKALMEKEHREEVEKLKEKHAEVIEKLQTDAKLAFSVFSKNFKPEVEMRSEELKTGCEIEEILVPKGDPEVDMAQQLASNEKTIENLRRQNERLSKTLNRLKEHRRISENRKVIDREKE